MSGVRRSAVLLPLACALLAGCGDSLATRPGPSRPAPTTEAVAPTPFCEAVRASREATEPVTGIGAGRRVGDVATVAAEIRRANQQVVALAPQDIRADFDRANELVERQLQLLEANGGDTLALARDPEVARSRSDPAYRAASQRVTAYVRSTCPV